MATCQCSVNLNVFNINTSVAKHIRHRIYFHMTGSVPSLSWFNIIKKTIFLFVIKYCLKVTILHASINANKRKVCKIILHLFICLFA